jgi:hypothetical protein
MIKPTQDDIGRGVIYRTAPAFEAEVGMITSLGPECKDPRRRTIFVRYILSGWGAQATNAEDLEWEFPTEGNRAEDCHREDGCVAEGEPPQTTVQP